MRTRITLSCTECKQRNYNTTKDKKTHPERLEMKKYCRFCSVRTEFGKIIWPGRDTMVKQLIAVVCVTVVAALLIAVIDFGAQNLIDVLVKINA